MYNTKLIRQLARSSQWQTLYQHTKEIASLQLFRNSSELTKIQLDFLQWLSLYYSLYQDLAMDKPYLSKAVIEDDIRTEAYLFLKSKEGSKKDTKKGKKEIDTSAGSVLFKRK